MGCAGIRGGYCDAETTACATKSDDHPTAEANPIANFSGVETAFFRGTVCIPQNGAAKTGMPFTINMIPTLHACMQVDQVHPSRSFTQCQSSVCETFAYYAMTVSGSGCPDDAFGKFDTSNTATWFEGPRRSFTFNPLEVNGTFEESLDYVEIPFLTNADAAEIRGVNDNEKNAKIKELAYQYAEEEDRRLVIELRNTHPEAACGPFDATNSNEGTIHDPDCTCFQVGFDDAF